MKMFYQPGSVKSHHILKAPNIANLQNPLPPAALTGIINNAAVGGGIGGSIGVGSASCPPQYAKCELCGKMLKQGNMKKHVDTVHHKKLYSDYDADMRTQFERLASEERKNHRCHVCDKSFGQFAHLKRHITTVHEERKNHKCFICDKSFGQLGHLKRHIVTVHEEKKVHKCHGCEKSFGQLGHLKRHILAVHHTEQQKKMLPYS